VTNIAELSPETAERTGARVRELMEQVNRVVLGQEEVVTQMLVTLFAGGHALLEGVPGTAKTLAIQCVARALDARFSRVQFTPDLMPTDVTGVNVFDERSRDFVFRPGPIFADIVLADEINRAPAKTQSALLEALQERQVTVDGKSHPLSRVFTVFASQNPIEYEGTYPLPEAALDRFALKIQIGYPSEAMEVGILDRYAGGFDAAEPESFGIVPVLGEDELYRLRLLVRAVRVEPEVRRYVVALVRRTREDPSLLLGASPRAAVALFRTAQAHALISGRDYVVPDDVKDLAVPALRHRVILSPEAQVEGVKSDHRVESAIATVPAPK
jgi:MoxR-like ATPase